MNAPPASAKDAKSVALVLADALSLGLPSPDYITISPYLAGRKFVSTVGFQFNDRNGQAPLPALQAWADRFGVTVSVDAHEDRSRAWHQFDFTHSGMRFHAYAEIVAATCACGHPQGSHWEHAEPGGDRKGCGFLGCICAAYAPEPSCSAGAS